MASILRTVVLLLLWLYIALFLGRWGLQLLFGDTIWWLGLINAFVPLLFAPLLLFGPLAVFVRQPLYNSGLLLLITFFLLSYGPFFLPKTAPPHLVNPTPFSIMTFNMLSTSRRVETINVIRDNGLPAIVALQETSPWLNQLLKQEMGALYPYQFYEYTALRRGISTLSRYPLERIEVDLVIDLNCRVFRVTVDTNDFVALTSQVSSHHGESDHHPVVATLAWR